VVAGEMALGDHICSMHTSVGRRDEVFVPFLRDGLAAGHKCVAAVTDPDIRHLQERLGGRGELARWLVSGQLQLLGVADRVMSPETSSVSAMVDFWESAQSAVAGAEGYEGVRVAAEAGWWLPQVSGIPQVLQFESILNLLVERHSAATLCMYDVRDLDGALMVDLVSTHPKVVVDGVWVNNPAYLPPLHLNP
jgi:MEDS: MEthanogen/methylotroph, DcmR Sensory domain